MTDQLTGIPRATDNAGSSRPDGTDVPPPRQSALETLTPPTFTFADLFAGIGGFRLGLEAVGGRCVYSNEMNPYSRQTYAANFDCSHPFSAGIREVDTENIPTHDLLAAGFPCQPFSLAGVPKYNSLNRKHGFECRTKGTLFYDIARIIERRWPACILLENVKNLLSHDKGKTFDTIRTVLTQQLGYHIFWRVLDASVYVPQHRERLFIVGFRQQCSFDFDTLLLPCESPRLGTILHPEDGTENQETPYTTGRNARVAPKYTLSEAMWRWLERHTEKHRALGNRFGCSVFGPDDKARTLSARYYKDGSEILIRQPDTLPRRLTPRECARLMGFDANSGRRFRIPVSDTQAYQQFGNAVVPPLVQAIAWRILPALTAVKHQDKRNVTVQATAVRRTAA